MPGTIQSVDRRYFSQNSFGRVISRLVGFPRSEHLKFLKKCQPVGNSSNKTTWIQEVAVQQMPLVATVCRSVCLSVGSLASSQPQPVSACVACCCSPSASPGAKFLYLVPALVLCCVCSTLPNSWSGSRSRSTTKTCSRHK